MTPLLMLIPYLASRAACWVVGADGIDVYRHGKVQRHVRWADIQSVEVNPLGTIIRHVSRPKLGEQLACVGLADGRKLRGIWRQVHPPKSPSLAKQLSIHQIALITLGCGVLSLVCITAHFTSSLDMDGRQFFMRLGALLALNGAVVGLWSAIRLRKMPLFLSVIPAALAFIGWAWVIAGMLHRLGR